MKIAIVALPSPEATSVVLPLPLSYVASLLEQQRHIVRVYDLALTPGAQLADVLSPLRAFRPHIIVLASDSAEQIALASDVVTGYQAGVLQIHTGLRDVAAGPPLDYAAWQFDQECGADEQSVIIGALLALGEDIDTLPFPARHLLAPESYPTRTLGGALQTPLLIGRRLGDRSVAMRNPRLITAELRSVIHEHGIWHFLFDGPPLTSDPTWLHDFLYGLIIARLGISWEGAAHYDALTPDLLRMCKRAGCETIRIEFEAMDVLDSQRARTAVRAAVDAAHAHDIGVRGLITLEPRYSSIPTVVDMSATFGLDDLSFTVQQPIAAGAIAERQHRLAQLADLAHERYQSVRSRQFFVNRFGSRLGPMIWRFGRIGLLGRTWRRYAVGAEQ